MHFLHCFALLTFLLLAQAWAAAGDAQGQPADAKDRYATREPLTLTVPRRPVTRKDYVDFVRPQAAGFENGPDRGQYGPRHALAALAVFALEGGDRLGEGIKQTLRHYDKWVRQTLEKEGGVFSMEGAVYCAVYFRELRKRNLMTADDEKWARALLLALREHQCAWRPKDGLWRGPHHRSQTQGLNHALAAALYPDEPDAPKWKAYADKVWSDWWDFRDVGINDTGYFYSSFGYILLAAELLGRKEVFTDPQARELLFDRVLWEVTPDGASVPYGAHGGYNSCAGDRICALELAARHTRDGRYRWVAHRLMNFGQARGFSSTHHHIRALNEEHVALASLFCDDSVAPVEPEVCSKLLMRKEVVRLTDAQAKQMFPEAGGVDCNMYMSQKVQPHKLIFRAGWKPGDMYMLVECFARHDPLNPTAILGFERYSSAFAEMASEKFVSRENAVRIDDLSGQAAYLGKKGHKGEKALPLGWAGMDVTVPAFADHAAATHARVHVTNYMGYSADHDREFLFVKNHFVLVRDETVFNDSFRAAIGPVWNAQHLGQPQGDHWLGVWFSGRWFQNALLYENPPWDLLVWHAPRPDRKIAVIQPPADPKTKGQLYSTRYVWEGDVQPGTRVQCVQVLLPHAPVREWSLRPQSSVTAMTADLPPVAEKIEVLRDEPGVAAVSVASGQSCEVAALNPRGERLELKAPAGELITDARAAYVELRDGKPKRVLLLGASLLRAAGESVFQKGERTAFEKGY